MEIGGPGAPGVSVVLLVVEAPGERQENAMILLRNLMELTAKDFPIKKQNVTHKNAPSMEIGGPGAPGAIALLLVVEAFGQRQENALILLRNSMVPTAKDFPIKNQNVTQKNAQVQFLYYFMYIIINFMYIFWVYIVDMSLKSVITTTTATTACKSRNSPCKATDTCCDNGRCQIHGADVTGTTQGTCRVADPFPPISEYQL